MMNGDYAKIAEGMGAVGITCTKVGEVGPAILKARELNAAGTACLIQVMANVEDRRASSPPLPPHFLLLDDGSAEILHHA